MTDLILEGRRILVIEDNAENMRLFQAVLMLEGAEVLQANRARAGIDMASAEQPDIILMDIQMPEMDGLAATRLLRADVQTRNIPIIAVTASVMPTDQNKTLQAGCDGYITKPIDPMQFCIQIAQFLEDGHRDHS